jgi:hypothetical protein
MSWYCFGFNDFRWTVDISFVDIGGIERIEKDPSN